MYCSKCAAELPATAKFCSKCGATTGVSPAAMVTSTGPQFESLIRRIATLDSTVFPHIRENVTLTLPALLVAVIAIGASALGGFLWYMVEFEPDGEFFWKTVLLGTVFGLLFWGIGVGAIYVMLRNVVAVEVKMDEVIRVAGFATAPLAVGLLIFIPEIAFGIGLLSVSVFLALLVVAFHVAFDLPADRALLAVIPGFAIWVLILPLITSADNPFGPGVFVFDWAQDSLEDIYNVFSPFT